MILEIAMHTVVPGKEKEYEAAMAAAEKLVSQSAGFRSLKLQRGIEQPWLYAALVEWDTVEDHMEGYVKSDRFREAQSYMAHFWPVTPVAQHFAPPVQTWLPS